ncbi:MAG: hypothetical protein H6981_07340 [Gammaproteobacteria bacterium]|nr:hypothetical protein [Gammaproteobacteria bacterium]
MKVVIHYFVPVDQIATANALAASQGFGPDMFAPPCWPSTKPEGTAYAVASAPTTDLVLDQLVDLVRQVDGAWVFPGDIATAAAILHIRRPDLELIP